MRMNAIRRRWRASAKKAARALAPDGPLNRRVSDRRGRDRAAAAEHGAGQAEARDHQGPGSPAPARPPPPAVTAAAMTGCYRRCWSPSRRGSASRSVQAAPAKWVPRTSKLAMISPDEGPEGRGEVVLGPRFRSPGRSACPAASPESSVPVAKRLCGQAVGVGPARQGSGAPEVVRIDRRPRSSWPAVSGDG